MGLLVEADDFRCQKSGRTFRAHMRNRGCACSCKSSNGSPGLTKRPGSEPLGLRRRLVSYPADRAPYDFKVVWILVGRMIMA